MQVGYIIGVSILLVLVIAVAIPVLQLLGFHLFLIRSGFTTFDYIMSRYDAPADENAVRPTYVTLTTLMTMTTTTNGRNPFFAIPSTPFINTSFPPPLPFPSLPIPLPSLPFP